MYRVFPARGCRRVAVGVGLFDRCDNSRACVRDRRFREAAAGIARITLHSRPGCSIPRLAHDQADRSRIRRSSSAHLLLVPATGAQRRDSMPLARAYDHPLGERGMSSVAHRGGPTVRSGIVASAGDRVRLHRDEKRTLKESSTKFRKAPLDGTRSAAPAARRTCPSA